MSAESAQSIANLTDVVTGIICLWSQLTRSGQSMSNLIDDVAAGSTNVTASVAGSKRTNKVRRRPNKHYRSKQKVFAAWADLIKKQKAKKQKAFAAWADLIKKQPAASAAAEAPATKMSMDEHMRMLDSVLNVQGIWSKEECEAICQAAKALPMGELTTSDKLTMIKAVAEYDTPQEVRRVVESFGAADGGDVRKPRTDPTDSIRPVSVNVSVCIRPSRKSKTHLNPVNTTSPTLSEPACGSIG